MSLKARYEKFFLSKKIMQTMCNKLETGSQVNFFKLLIYSQHELFRE